MTDQTQPQQLTRADLKGMTPAQIVAARKAGQLHTLLAGRKPDKG